MFLVSANDSTSSNLTRDYVITVTKEMQILSSAPGHHNLL